MAKRTITLSDRPPVTVNEDKWGLVASATDKEYDNQYEFQANRITKWGLYVRTDEGDKRAIVYAVYSYTSKWASERDYHVKHGIMLDSATPDELCKAIKDVAERMADSEHHDEDARRWKQLADECIADLPAEEV